MRVEKLLRRSGQRKRLVKEVIVGLVIFLQVLHHQLRVKRVEAGSGKVDIQESHGLPLLRLLLGVPVPVVLASSEREKKKRRRLHLQLAVLVH
jgi:hypothetical protein